MIKTKFKLHILLIIIMILCQSCTIYRTKNFLQTQKTDKEIIRNNWRIVPKVYAFENHGAIKAETVKEENHYLINFEFYYRNNNKETEIDHWTNFDNSRYQILIDSVFINTNSKDYERIIFSSVNLDYVASSMSSEFLYSKFHLDSEPHSGSTYYYSVIEIDKKINDIELKFNLSIIDITTGDFISTETIKQTLKRNYSQKIGFWAGV